ARRRRERSIGPTVGPGGLDQCVGGGYLVVIGSFRPVLLPPPNGRRRPMQRRHGGVRTAGAVLTALVTVSAAPIPALAQSPHQSPHQSPKASDRDFFFSGRAGGSLVQSLGATVRSDLTGASGVEGQGAASDSHKVTGVNLGDGLVKLGAVS